MKSKKSLLLHLLIFPLLGTLLSGCLYTRVTEKNLEWGNKNLFADCSKIKGNCVYTDDAGNHYIWANVHEYQETPAFIGLSTKPLGIFNAKFDGIDYRQSSLSKTGTKGYVAVKIPQIAYDYLVSEKTPESCTTPVEFVPCETIPPKAKSTPIRRAFPEPFVLEKAGARDRLLNATFLGTRRNIFGTLSLGLLPLSLCCDVVGTVAYTTSAYVFVIPGMLCLSSISEGLGIEAPFFSAPVAGENDKK